MSRKCLAVFLACLMCCVSMPAQSNGIIGGGVIRGTASGGGGITWILVQHPNNIACTSSGPATATCTVTTSSTTVGDLLVLVSSIWVNYGTSMVSGPAISGISGDGTWTHCPSQFSQVNYAFNDWDTADCEYILSATGGATSIAVTWSNLSGSNNDTDVELLEFKRSTGTATYEPCGAGGATACTATLPTSSACTSCTGPTPTVTGTDVVIAWNANENECLTVASPYNVSPSPDTDHATMNVFGIFSWSLSQATGVAAVYSCNSGGFAASAAAFK